MAILLWGKVGNRAIDCVDKEPMQVPMVDLRLQGWEGSHTRFGFVVHEQ